MLSRVVACVWIVVVSCGCSVDHFRAETELFPDGSVDRSIWQPLNEEQRKRWPEVRDGIADERLQSEPWAVFDINRPKQKDGKPNHPKNNGSSARGRFGSVEEIPEHYRKEAPPGFPDSTLKRKVEREDFVFVTEHRWEETLTDGVKLEDIPAARKELINFMVPITAETLRQELEPEYDVSAVEPWLRDEGAIWLDELVSLWIDLCLRNDRPWLEDKELKSQAEKRFHAVNARHGLKDLEKETQERFCRDKAKQLIRNKDGTLITDEFATKLARELMERESKETPNRFVRRRDKLIEDKYGSDKVFQDQLWARTAPIVGLHSFSIPPQDFDYRLTMPGHVVASNGELVSSNRVRWRFDASRAFPFGYSMRCRSLQPNDANQRGVFKNVPIKTSNDCQRLVRLLRSKPEWHDVLLKCVEEKSRQPLLDLHTKVLHRNDFPERLKFDDLAELLHLEPK